MHTQLLRLQSQLNYLIRRTAVDFGVPLLTNMQLAQRLADALDRIPIDQLKVRPWSAYHK